MKNLLISLKPKDSKFPKKICNNKGEALTNPIDIASSFNYFSSVAPNTKSNIKETFKPF